MPTNPEWFRFSPLEENILAAVTSDGGLAPEDIAERVGVLCSGFFLTVLKNMADRNILLVAGGGYVPAATPGGGAGCACRLCATRAPTGPHSSLQSHAGAGTSGASRADPATATRGGADPTGQVSA